MDPTTAGRLLADLLATTGTRPLSRPPIWPSGIADDHTPVEFSVAFNEHERPTLRILGEALDSAPTAATNALAARRFIATQAERFGLSLSQFDRVAKLFDTDDPAGGFALWLSLVFRHRRAPEFKTYFNPELTGVDYAPALVADAMQLLGLAGSYRDALRHGIRPGRLGQADRLTFFALDLHDDPHARVKLYLSHHDAQISDVVRAAGAVPGSDTDELAGFCATAGGGVRTFDGRPLISSYTFLGDADHAAGYSVYVPIRSYVNDDEQARHRVIGLLDRYGFDSSRLDPMIAALTDRRLDEGVGLIAHVSLRLGRPRPGVTVYLSAEAYRVTPPHARQEPTDHPTGCAA
ncbi:MAG TPA: tryptophan dimethylallyltransferase family protein [Micromonosporaceae bacterium]